MKRTTQRVFERLSRPIWTWPVPSGSPHKCPVCNGRGRVPAGFYEQGVSGERYTLSDLTPETCKSCKGRGVIWR